MENNKSLIKIAGTMNFIIGVMAFNIPVYGVLMIITGTILYLLTTTPEKIKDNKVVIIIMAIICVPLNLISAILLFCSYDNIEKYNRIHGKNAPPKVVYKLDKESQRLDLLIKLGVGMVFISGILFATTTWDFINIIGKAIMLIVFGILFLCLSLFTEKKLKLYKSSYMYWLLSMSFFILVIVGFLYFGVAGSYLTYKGTGSDLAYFITFITASGLITTTYLKFQKKYLLYGTYSTLFIGLFYILSFLKQPPVDALSIISVIVLIINVLSPKKSILFNFSKILSLLLFAFIIKNAEGANDLSLLLASIINITNLNSLLIIDSKEEPILYIILTYLLIYLGIVPLTALGDYNALAVAIITALYTLVINTNILQTNSTDKLFNNLFYSMTTLITFVISCNVLPITSPFIIIIYIIVNEISKYGLFNSEKQDITRFVEPISLLCLIISFQVNIVSEFHIQTSLAIASLLFSVLSLLYIDKKDKMIYFIFGMISTFFTLVTNMYNPNIFVALLSIISALILFTKSYEKENNNVFSVLTYILLLSSMYCPFVVSNLLEINILLVTLIFILLIIVTGLILKNDIISKIGLFYIVMPILSLIGNTELSYEYTSIIRSFLLLYILFLILKLFIKDATARNVLGIIGVIFSLSEVFFVNNMVNGIYSGVIAIILIFIGFKYEELSPLLKFGIVLTIINIIYQLKELWQFLPFWLYLLVGGLTIIGLVTYKELKRQKENEEKNKVN